MTGEPCSTCRPNLTLVPDWITVATETMYRELIAGDLERKIPKSRQGTSLQTLQELRRVDQALFAVVMEAQSHWVSTRKVDDLVKALGAEWSTWSPTPPPCCALSSQY